MLSISGAKANHRVNRGSKEAKREEKYNVVGEAYKPLRVKIENDLKHNLTWTKTINLQYG